MIWEVGLTFLRWVRARLDAAGRSEQTVLADGNFDVVELWRELPERVMQVVRTARNCALYHLPQAVPNPGPGRSPSYGEATKKPFEWLYTGVRKWPTETVRVRGQGLADALPGAWPLPACLAVAALGD